LNPASEIGRELKVSELKPGTVVWLFKENSDRMATMWVVDVGDVYVHFYAGATQINFLTVRSGADLESVSDDTHTRIQIFEYLGVP
jgi:hypothetical protein